MRATAPAYDGGPGCASGSGAVCGGAQAAATSETHSVARRLMPTDRMSAVGRVVGQGVSDERGHERGHAYGRCRGRVPGRRPRSYLSSDIMNRAKLIEW